MFNPKALVAVTLMASMMAMPAMAADNTGAVDETAVAEAAANEALASEAQNVLNDYNAAVVAAYEKDSVALNRADFASDELMAQLEGRNDYIRSTQNVYDIVAKSNDFKIDRVNAIDENTVKVMATRTIDQTLSDDATGSFPFYSSTQEGYVLNKTDDGWKIARVVDAMYGESPALDQFVEDFEKDDANVVAKTRGITGAADGITEDLGGIDYLNLPSAENYLSNTPQDVPDPSQPSANYMYSKAKARDYALKWGGSNRNPAFGDYSNSGGDCANFTSQCLNAGGMTYIGSWTPGGYQFINVNGQRDMLINNNRADGYYKSLPSYPNGLDTTGTVVHYTNGASWYHAVIITQDPQTSYNSIRITGHTADVVNGPIWPDINQIRSFRVH